MNKKLAKKIMLVYGTVLGVFTVFVGALLIWQVIDTYLTGTSADYAGTSIFERGDVVRRLAKISPALWIWFALAVIGFGLSVAFTVTDKISKPDVRYALYRAKKKLPAAIADDKASDSLKIINREKLIVRILWLCVGAVGLAGAIYGIVYLCIPSHFSQSDVPAEMRAMVKNILPWVTWTLIFACGVAVYEGASAKKQLPEVKKLTAGNKAVKEAKAPISNKFLSFVYKYRLWLIRGAVACFAVAFIIAGISNGSARDVLLKAINICSECIGLG